MYQLTKSITLRLIVLALGFIIICKFSCGPGSPPNACSTGKVVKKSANLIDTLLTGPGNNLYCINMLTPGIGYISGEKGTILKTLNGGNNWFAQTSGTGLDLMGIYTLDADSAVTVGKSGLVLRTTNKGALWKSYASGTPQDLNSVYFPNKDTGYACGNAGVILKTYNGGFSWTTQSTGTLNNLYCINFISKDTGVAVGQGGKIMRTVDGGTNWTGLTGPVLKDLHGVDFIDSKLMAVGDSGRIIMSTDYGAAWVSMTSPTTLNLKSVIWCMQKIAYAVGDSGVDLRYNGTSWTSGPRGTNNRLNFVHSSVLKQNTEIRCPTVFKDGDYYTVIDNNPELCNNPIVSITNLDSCNWCFSLNIPQTVNYTNLIFTATCPFNHTTVSCNALMNTGGSAAYEYITNSWLGNLPLNNASTLSTKIYGIHLGTSFPAEFKFYLTTAAYDAACYIELDDIRCCDTDLQK